MNFKTIISFLKTNLLFLIVIGSIILITVLFFSMLHYINKKKKFNLICEIYLKNGNRMTLKKDIRDDKFKYKTDDVERTYLIDKEAIKYVFEEKFLYSRMKPVISFYENVAYPFVHGFIGKEGTQSFLGSELANKLFKQKIIDEVGGLGESKVNTKMLLIIMAVIAIMAVAAYFIFVKKEPPK